ncbi:MAG: GAF domain-containing protein, partial [Leptolyngbya sp. SIO4C1]|nr:GAF domain-containing protein [Leptolyngbya sp. SIO4C1]
AVVLLIDILLAQLLGRSIANPLKRLQRATEAFVAGNRQAKAEINARDEVGQVAAAFNALTSQVAASERLLRDQANEEAFAAKRARMLADLASQIRQSLAREQILETAVSGVREILQVDRVVFYQFDSDDFQSGSVVAESVGAGWLRAEGRSVADPLTPETIERFQSGLVSYIEDIDQTDLSDCHCELLRKLEVKANIVAPVLAGNQLDGLLCAHQCSMPRHWTEEEFDLMRQLSTQLGYALSQASLLSQQQVSAERERQLADLVIRMRESLDRDKIFRTVVQEARSALKADRVGVYLFDEAWKGTFVAESVAEGWPAALGSQVADPCFANQYVEQYRQGRVKATDDIYTAGLTDCHLEQLAPFKVRANLVAPILENDQLLGLLIAHQCAAPRHWQEIDVNFLKQAALQLGFTLEQTSLFQQQQQTAWREQQLADLTIHMREALDRDQLFRTVVQEARAALKTDRVGVYLFDETWKGTFVAESVAENYPAALGSQIADPCFADKYVEQYRQGRVKATDDIYKADLTECHLSQLEPYKVRANLVTPILEDEKLLGLLIAHECSGPRQWNSLDISFLQRVAIQLGFALEQLDTRLAADTLSEERRQRQEALQLQLLNLLEDVEGAARGDLTVRADVTAGEIGTVADFFNSIVESLRQIVTQVKDSAGRVNQSLGSNEFAIRELAEDALKQAEQTTQTLNSVEAMSQMITQVADQAQQAASVAKTASATAEQGGVAMDLTVQNILSLRETVGQTAKKVKRLGESSQQISKVVSLINQIAMQTNLLAINAGIEAARAGEEGQGFAAVAEEVGELAARSSAATQEIERIVESIQRETSDVVEAIEQSTAQVVEGTRRVEDSKESLTEILEVSRQIDQLVQSISGATVSQVEISASVSLLMQQIAAVSKRTSESSAQVSDALRQTVEVAHELQASMATFKVDER